MSSYISRRKTKKTNSAKQNGQKDKLMFSSVAVW